MNFRLKLFGIIIGSGFCYYVFENYLVSKINKFKQDKFEVFYQKNLKKVFNLQETFARANIQIEN